MRIGGLLSMTIPNIEKEDMTHPARAKVLHQAPMIKATQKTEINFVTWTSDLWADREEGGPVDANMQITISGSQGGNGRRVATEVDMENYTTVDEVGDIEGEKTEKDAKDKQLNDTSETENDTNQPNEGKAKERTSKEEEKRRISDDKHSVDLDKVVIKKREKKMEDKPVDDKVLVVKKPNSMIAKLAEKRKELSLSAPTLSPKSEHDKMELRKKFKEKYLTEEKITDKVLNMALESVFFDEEQGYQLINKLLEQEEEHNEVNDETKNDEEEITEDSSVGGPTQNEEQKSEISAEADAAESQNSQKEEEQSVDAHDELDFEAEEPEKTE